MKYTYSTENSTQNKEKNSKKWLYAIIFLIVLGVGLFLVYWFLIKNDKSEDFIVTTAHQNYASLEYEKEGNIINLKAIPKYNVEFYGWRYGENGEIFSTALETSVKFEKQNDTVVYYADFRPLNDTHFEYDKNLENGTATITIYDFSSNDIIFPSYFTDQWDFYSVTNISADFSETNITSVVFPEELYSINESQFSSCKSLESVTILGKTEIIDRSAFSSCNSISSLNLNEGLKKIYEFAFDSIKLTELYLPSTVDFISSTAFQNSNLLEKITVSENNPNFKDYDSNVVVDIKNNSLILGCKNSTIPENVVEIGDYAFYKCSGLTSISIPNSVKVLGVASFTETGLTEINLNHVSEIRNSVFSGCKNLATVKYSSLTMLSSIGDYAFDNTGLTSFTIPRTVKSIGVNCFANSNNLETLNFQTNSTLETISEGAFSNTGITSLYIPSSVNKIGNNAFAESLNLNIYFQNENPPTIESETFNNIANLNIYVKFDYIEKYKEAEIWLDYADKIDVWQNV